LTLIELEGIALRPKLRVLIAYLACGSLVTATDGNLFRPVPFSTDHLAEFMEQDAAGTGYRINFAKSEAQNNLRKGRATKAVVEVRDRNNKPVAGALVLLLLPNSGPSGTFVGGGQSVTVTTNAAGQAVVSYTPNQVAGSFQLTASAQVNGVTVATGSLAQANLAAAAVAGGLSGTAIAVIVGVAAAAAVGIGLGMSGGGSSTPATPPVVTPPPAPSVRIIGGGTPVFGPRVTFNPGRAQ
jgi:hypothetical protein